MPLKIGFLAVPSRVNSSKSANPRAFGLVAISVLAGLRRGPGAAFSRRGHAVALATTKGATNPSCFGGGLATLHLACIGLWRRSMADTAAGLAAGSSNASHMPPLTQRAGSLGRISTGHTSVYGGIVIARAPISSKRIFLLGLFWPSARRRPCASQSGYWARSPYGPHLSIVAKALLIGPDTRVGDLGGAHAGVAAIANTAPPRRWRAPPPPNWAWPHQGRFQPVAHRHQSRPWRDSLGGHVQSETEWKRGDLEGDCGS